MLWAVTVHDVNLLAVCHAVYRLNALLHAFYLAVARC